LSRMKGKSLKLLVAVLLASSYVVSGASSVHARTSPEEVSRDHALAEAKRSVVLVVAFSEGRRSRLGKVFSHSERPRGRTRVASGVVVDSIGTVLTTATICDRKARIEVVLPDGQRIPYRVLARDPVSNLGLLRAATREPRRMRPLVLGSSEELAAGGGATVLAWSPWGMSPILVHRVSRVEAPSTLPLGRLLELDFDCLPGSSGGAVVNERGELLGVISGTVSLPGSAGASAGASSSVSARQLRRACAAIPVEEIRKVLKDLAESGYVRRGFLGVHVDPVPVSVTGGGAEETGRAVYVSGVLPESPAAEAGLEQGDVILSVDGCDVTDPRELMGIVSRKLPGECIRLVVLKSARGGPTELSAVLAQMPPEVAEARIKQKVMNRRLVLQKKLSDLDRQARKIRRELEKLHGE